ncbi:MAG: Rrf2 family transcriptional regulator [Alphaproteobacteria bacterium]|nr:Rrf2 family transcriptional regulator [Alphaproteobacteria bacterium]
MRISTKGRHAVMAMVDLACNAKEKPVPLAEVAERQMISLSYLEQLIAKLKKAGLVKSTRGPGGGYVLAQPADQMSVQQIVMAVDTGVSRQPAVPHQTEAQTARRLTDRLWQKMDAEVQKFLKSVTLDDVTQSKD